MAAPLNALPFQYLMRGQQLQYLDGDAEAHAIDQRDLRLEDYLGALVLSGGGGTGPPGPVGPAGPAGPPGATQTVSYVHSQATVSATWVVTHNLGWYPNVTVIDSAGTDVEGDVVHNSATQLTLRFSGGFTGQAFLS